MYLLVGQEDETTVAQKNVTNNRNNSARRCSPVINLHRESYITPTKPYLVPGEKNSFVKL